ncbi:TPA: diadenosine tetraphosphate hydrolase [Candidatus Acetothermia bacterium]|nr:diadenosine tetraphosphate hydrolase [Candidatus Acetothermia bacterium]HAZ30232.1 diadenosine tetraphosphate hydrolase [Candidatus Acetothermia bacterium]
MPDERASGMVLFRNHVSHREYMIIKSKIGGHWGFPKGRLELGEDEIAAALREVAEEVGVTRPQVQPGFVERVAYRFVRARRVVTKEVAMFLAATDEDGTPGGEEVEALEWLPVPEALTRLSYPEQREVLLRAEAFLQAQTQHAGA